MRNKYVFTAVLLLAVALGAALFTGVYAKSQEEDENKVTVVTSFYPIYIAAINVVGDCSGLEVINLSEPQTGCLHDFQLTPEDMRLLSGAELFLVNGGGMESFLEDTAKQYPLLKIAETAAGLELSSDGHGEIHAGEDLAHTGDQGEEQTEEMSVHSGDHGEAEGNAHVWMSVGTYRRQVAAIAEQLCAIAGEYTEEMKANASAYDQKLAELEEQQAAIREAAAGSRIISFHEAYEYIAEDYGLSIGYEVDLDEERKVSAGEVADVLKSIKEDGISIIFAEELYGSGLAETVSKEADVTVCYLDTLVRGDYKPDSYLDGMQANINILQDTFGVE